MSPADRSAADGVFVDTSALFALLDADDVSHPRAAKAWEALVDNGTALHTSNYVVVELSALLQRRLGLDAMDALYTHILPWVHVLWIDEALHGQAVAGVLAARRRDLSLVDCASLATIRRLGLRRAFTLDQHFAGQGLEVLP